jgi:2-oxoglutarate ferredoxin oxidoreductase subunit beta
MDLSTKYKINWCPGCPNFAILEAFKQATTDLVTTGKLKIENLVVGSGIGCHGKISDYLNINGFYGLHGRIIPTMTGVKLANPALKVVAFSGDGDSLAEGMEHFIHGAKRNSDISLFLHNNQVFALTIGQVTPTSSKGYKGRTTPEGSVEEPIIPLALSLLSGATFIARTYALKIPETKEIMKQAMEHKGFALVEIIQPCITFFDSRDYFKDRLEWLPKTYDKKDYQGALKELTNPGDKTKLGIFYQASKPTFEAQL